MAISTTTKWLKFTLMIGRQIARGGDNAAHFWILGPAYQFSVVADLHGKAFDLKAAHNTAWSHTRNSLDPLEVWPLKRFCPI